MSRPDGDGGGRLCLCGKPETDSVHHRPQTSDEEHLYEPAPTEAEFYPAAHAAAPPSPVDEMVRLSAEAGLYGDMGAAAAAVPDLRGQIVGWLLNLTGRNLNPTAADLGWLGNEADDLLAGPLQRLVEQAAEAARLRAVVERVAATCRTMGLTLHSVPHAEAYAEIAVDLQRALDGTDG